MFWPIVGSMFMFRLLVYLNAVRHERRPSTLLETCAYFALWPNAFFPLFPVVDYQTFRETYYNDERRRIYQTELDGTGVVCVNEGGAYDIHAEGGGPPAVCNR